jgi:glycerol-3-phosphate dehydrogenase (NAD(P)+)
VACRSAHELAKKEGVDMPITSGIYKVIHEGANPLEVVQEVMTRDLGPEVDIQVLEAARNS